MKRFNKLERHIKETYDTKLSVTTPSHLDTRILSDSVNTLKTIRSKKPTGLIWRTLMENRTPGFAVTATIIVVIMLGFTFFGHGIDGASPAIAQMKHAMAHVPWIHAINDNSTCSDESWVSFEQKIEITKKQTGKITYKDYINKIKYVYSPETETITLSEFSDDTLPLGTSTLFELIDSLVAREQASGAQLTHKKGLYHDIPVDILELNRTENNWAERIEIFVDRANHLPLASSVISGGIGSEPNYIGSIVFDYPPTGPQDIFALGLPRSTKTIDLRPKPEVLAVLKTYRAYRNSAPAKFAAVAIFDFEASVHALELEEDLFGYATLMYNNQQHLYHQEYKIVQSKAQYTYPMGNTFASVANWCQQSNGTVPTSTDLWDGVYHYYHNHSADNSHWEKQPRKEDHRIGQLSFLQQKAWPIIASTAKQSAPIQYNFIENGHSKKHGLICIERLQQGDASPGRHKAMPPTRNLYYLNPAKDYICQRLDEYRRLDAPWQQDKSWCHGVDPNRIRPDATIIIEVNAYSQTNEMKWYPKMSTRTGHGSSKNGTPTMIIETIFFEEQIDFPEGIFDPKKLPGKGSN